MPSIDNDKTKTYSMKLHEIRTTLGRLASPKRAEKLKGFFKATPGGYGEGDHFLGIRVPELRRIAKLHRDVTTTDKTRLLRSPVHEERLLAIFMLAADFSKGNDSARKKIYGLYLKNTRHVNNWDLVDASAPRIVGAYLSDKDRGVIYRLAKSKDLWERRISIISTAHFIKRGEFSETLKVARILLQDEHDLIHKAVGWMLREVGKRDIRTEERFLRRLYKKMHRTMLRYAIERFPEGKRQAFLKGRI